MADTTASADVLYTYGGTQVNNLINILRSNDDNDIATLKFPPYMDLNSVKSYLQNNRNNFTVFTLNVQSLNSQFSEIQSLISDLSKDNLLVDAVSKKHGYTQMMMLVYSTCQHAISYIKVKYVVVMVGW